MSESIFDKMKEMAEDAVATQLKQTQLGKMVEQVTGKDLNRMVDEWQGETPQAPAAVPEAAPQNENAPASESSGDNTTSAFGSSDLFPTGNAPDDNEPEQTSAPDAGSTSPAKSSRWAAADARSRVEDDGDGPPM